jgi:hypothetical protein
LWGFSSLNWGDENPFTTVNGFFDPVATKNGNRPIINIEGAAKKLGNNEYMV